MAKIQAGNTEHWLLNGIPHQRGQFDISGIGDYVELYSLTTNKSLTGRILYSEYTDATDTPYATKQALIDDLKTFFFRSVSGGGGGAVDSVFSRTGTVTAENGDYTSTQITDTSTVGKATVKASLDEVWKEATEAASTGVVDGMLLTLDVGNLTFSIGVGNYHISKASIPNLIDDVVYTGSTTNSLPSLAVDTQYYVFIDENEVLTYQTTAPLPNDYKEKALIGALIVIGGAINNFSNLQVPVTNIAWRIKNLTNAIGLINARGNVISNGGVDLGIAKTQGYLHTYRDGRDGIDQGSFAEVLAINTSGASLDRFILAKQDNISNPTAQFLDVGNYDNAGVISAIGGGSGASANWFVFIFPDAILVMYPQVFYSTLSEAESNIDKDAQSLIVPELFETSGFSLGVYTVNKNATNLGNTSEALFRNGSKFGEFVGGASVSVASAVVYTGSSADITGDLVGNTNYTQTFTVTGAVIGDQVECAFNDTLYDTITGASQTATAPIGKVVSANTVELTFQVQSFLAATANWKTRAKIIK